MSKEEGTYDIYVYCTNCNYHGRIDIKKGSKVNGENCPNCGCETLVKNEI